jgi:amidase
MASTRREFLASTAGIATAASAPPWLGGLASPSARFPTAAAALAALRARRISAQELVKEQLARIAERNPALNAIVNVLGDSALASAREADASLARGKSLGPLHGLPVTVKDTFEIKGVRTTAGFEPLRNHVPSEDAASVARLRGAGAVILGNTNVPPLAGDWQSDNPIYGRTKNPWNLGYTPGGSSGGSAAAVAAGLGFLSIGSDIGGSIRVPAAWTGTYGHKPTLNLVPLRGHIPPMPGAVTPPPSLPVCGPMARSAEDLLIGLRALGGPEGDDAVAYRWSLPAPRHSTLKPFRVGYVLDHPACPLTPEVREVLTRAIDRIRAAGVTITEGWPDAVDPLAQFASYFYLVSLTVFGPQLDESKFEETRRIAWEATRTPFEVVTAQVQTDPWKKITARDEERMIARKIWQRWFQSHDVFLMPVVFTTALPHMPPMSPIKTSVGERPYFDLLWWISFATLTGCPAVSAPVGVTKDGLPIGLQIMGPYLEDATPITFAARLSDLLGGFVAPKGYS